MGEIGFTIIQKRATPLMQSAASLVIGWTGMLICRLLHKTSGEEFFAALIALVFFAIINTVVSIANSSYLRYTVPSLYLYVLIVTILFLSAKWLSGISIWNDQMKEYRMMLVSVSLFYVIVSSLARLLRAVFNAIEKEM